MASNSLETAQVNQRIVDASCQQLAQLEYEQQDPLRVMGRVTWQCQEENDLLCGVEFLNMNE
ncbi:hypothetical protein [Candidatus Accumulibacter phosphatis]|uniref:PilZ domain-containing protein n=2 Tax=Candidatus Accumulibacter TaxID=327159 RepID=A0A5S4EP30_9PROT|nr:hypothetical protein [Candidatus Accumulibacter phosphatis]TMQ77189.1 hypothetical protein ACCUM_3406 [Candidatus Accumulibacter phosphatis]